MGRKEVSKPLEKHAWILEILDEVNNLPRSGWEANTKARNRTTLANRRNLRRLIRLVAHSTKIGEPIGHTVWDVFKVDVAPNGKISIPKDMEGSVGLVRRIIDEKLPIDRLRICPACDRIYWMKTARSLTCGEKQCSDRANYLNNKRRRDGSLQKKK